MTSVCVATIDKKIKPGNKLLALIETTAIDITKIIAKINFAIFPRFFSVKYFLSCGTDFLLVRVDLF